MKKITVRVFLRLFFESLDIIETLETWLSTSLRRKKLEKEERRRKEYRASTVSQLFPQEGWLFKRRLPSKKR